MPLTMPLQHELDVVHADFMKKMPDLAARFDHDTEVLIEEGIGGDGPQVGDFTPDFELTDQLGRMVRSVALRDQGPLVISFYRGGWCPYCNVELLALERSLSRITKLGASLVAISPQLPDESMTVVEKIGLTFPVLSDVDNVVARQFGLVFALSPHLRPIYVELGADLPHYNGTDTFELPVPGTFVVDRDGEIVATYVNADYKQRMEPDRIIEALEDISE